MQQYNHQIRTSALTWWLFIISIEIKTVIGYYLLSSSINWNLRPICSYNSKDISVWVNNIEIPIVSMDISIH